MADYTLKLDIDAKLLEKKIKDALKNAGFGGGSSSGSGGGVGGGIGGGFGGKNQFNEKQKTLHRDFIAIFSNFITLYLRNLLFYYF